MKKTSKPTIETYKQMRAKHPDAILLFRVGDFYEMLEDDAATAHEILGIALASRKHEKDRIRVAGFPHHSLDIYLPKLVRAGKRVAICEHLENPATKKLVKQGIQ